MDYFFSMLFPKSRREIYEMLLDGNRKIETGDFTAAIHIFTQIIRNDPDNQYAYNGRGWSYFMQKKYESALDNYNKAIELYPKFAVAHNNRGLVHRVRGNLDKAFADFTRATEISPELDYPYFYRGMVLIDQRKFELAKNEFTKAIEIEIAPYYFRALVCRGFTFSRLRDFDAAITDYDRALKIDPNDSIAYTYRGFAYFRKNNLEAAFTDFKHAEELRPDDYAFYPTRGEVYFELKRYPEALTDFLKAFELKNDYNFTLAGLAVTHHALGNKDDATRCWQDLLKLDARYGDTDWLQKELNWADALVEEARKLVSESNSQSE